MKIIISLLIGISIISIASYMPMSYSFPIIATFIDDPLRCDAIPPIQLTEELGENPTAPIPFPKDEEIGGSLGIPIRAVCVANDVDNANDFDVAITNNSPNFFTNLFFVADPGISIGNADGTIGGDDAFRIDNLGVNKNLVSESMRPDGIFEPGETWNFIVTNFGAANAGESPAFFSRGIGAVSAAIPRSSSSIVAQPSIDFTMDANAIPLENFAIAPLKQIQLGIHSSDVICKNSLELIFKSSDESPACVKPESILKLVERTWAKPIPSMFRDEPSDVNIPSEILDLKLTNVVDANNQFAIDFYSQVTTEKQENVFFSPWSISTAFSIAYEGARGTTADEIRDTFGFIADDEQRRNSFAVVHDNLNKKDSQYKLHVANALWIAEGFELFSEYVDVAKNYYDSEVDTVNFEADGAEIINEWVSDKTEEKIEELFDPDSLGGVRLAITNAIYFNGTWVLPFDEKRTIEQDFIVNSQKTVKAPMMNRDFFYNHTSTDELQILELPYLGDRLSMLILLPNEIDGIKSLEESLDAQKISQWNDELVEGRLFVQIPKFTMETDYDLIPELKELGIIAAFGPADFSGISNADLFISQAVHKAFVDVNEKGTEAAAATGIAMRESMPPSFRADHPFVFIIQDKETGNILFIGKVVDPTA